MQGRIVTICTNEKLNSDYLKEKSDKKHNPHWVYIHTEYLYSESLDWEKNKRITQSNKP